MKEKKAIHHTFPHPTNSLDITVRYSAILDSSFLNSHKGIPDTKIERHPLPFLNTFPERQERALLLLCRLLA